MTLMVTIWETRCCSWWQTVLQSLIREEDTVSRWGGDEFICLLLEVKQEADVIRLAEKIVNQIAVDFEFNGLLFL